MTKQKNRLGTHVAMYRHNGRWKWSLYGTIGDYLGGGIEKKRDDCWTEARKMRKYWARKLGGAA